MKLRTNVRALCELAMFAHSDLGLNVQETEKLAKRIVQANLELEKTIHETRLKRNDELIGYIKAQKSDEYLEIWHQGGIDSIKAISKTCKAEIQEINDKLYDLQFI